MKKRALLFISTTGHIPTILSVADLLNKSGAYSPMIVFFEHSLYDINLKRYSLYHYNCYVWRSHKFDEVNLKPKSEENIARSGYCNHSTSVVKTPLIINKLRALMGLIYGAAVASVGVFDYIRGCLTVGCPRLLYYLLGPGRSPMKEDANDLRKIFLCILEEKWGRKNRARTSGRIRRRLYEIFDGLLYGLSHIKELMEKFDALILQVSPNLIILPEENLLYNYHYMVETSHKRNIPCCVVPFTIVNKNEWLVSYSHNARYQADKGWNRLLAVAFPEWTAIHEGRLLILPRIHVLLAEYLGCRPEFPWLINSGSAEAIAVEGRFMEQYYASAGIERRRLFVTGALSDDRIYMTSANRDRYRLELASKNGWGPIKRIILLALPPNQFAAGIENSTDFLGYDDLIDFMIREIGDRKRVDDVVIISLHPRTRRNDICFENKTDIMIIERPIEDLIPLADVFVAVASATIRLAISCALPVINYDVYRFNYNDYICFPGVVEVTERLDFSNTLGQMLNDEGYYESLRQFQLRGAKTQGVLDGGAGSRLLGLFNRLVNSDGFQSSTRDAGGTGELGGKGCVNL